MKIAFKTYKIPKNEWELSLSLHKEYWKNGSWYFLQLSLFKIIFSLKLDTRKG